MDRAQAKKVISLRNKTRRALNKASNNLWRGKLSEFSALQDRVKRCQAEFDEASKDFPEALRAIL